MVVVIVNKIWKIIHGGEQGFNMIVSEICDLQWKKNGGQKGFNDRQQDM